MSVPARLDLGVREPVVAARVAVLRNRGMSALHPDVVVAEHRWWEDDPDLALPGADPTDPSGANYNLLVGDDVRDPVSGSVPMRGTHCEITRVETGAWVGTRRFVVCGRSTTAGDVVVLRLRPVDGGPLPTFRPGQHVTVALPSDPDHARSYSLIGAAVEAPSSLVVGVRAVHGGRVSTVLPAAGSALLVTSPRGAFAIPVRHIRPIVLIAAGIGITPFLGHLETLAAAGPHVPEVRLHVSNRHAVPFHDRLDELEAAIPQLTVVHHSTSTGRRFRADDVEQRLIDEGALFFLCGPAAMITDVTAGLVARGVPRTDVRDERFHVPPPPPGDDAPATVRLARTGTELHWEPGQGTLLDLVEAAGVAVTHGCRVGQCESCAVGVLDGDVRALVEPPVPLDGECLTCQAVPQGDVVLDL